MPKALYVMASKMEQTEFSLTVLREGLTAISSDPEKQLSLHKDGMEYLDDVFDPMPLNYLPWLEESGNVKPDIANEIRCLYANIEKAIGHLGWQEEDTFIAKNNNKLQAWRETAAKLVNNLNAV